MNIGHCVSWPAPVLPSSNKLRQFMTKKAIGKSTAIQHQPWASTAYCLLPLHTPVPAPSLTPSLTESSSKGPSWPWRPHISDGHAKGEPWPVVPWDSPPYTTGKRLIRREASMTMKMEHGCHILVSLFHWDRQAICRCAPSREHLPVSFPPHVPHLQSRWVCP